MCVGGRGRVRRMWGTTAAAGWKAGQVSGGGEPLELGLAVVGGDAAGLHTHARDGAGRWGAGKGCLRCGGVATTPCPVPRTSCSHARCTHPAQPSHIEGHDLPQRPVFNSPPPTHTHNRRAHLSACRSRPLSLYTALSGTLPPRVERLLSALDIRHDWPRSTSARVGCKAGQKHCGRVREAPHPRPPTRPSSKRLQPACTCLRA